MTSEPETATARPARGPERARPSPEWSHWAVVVVAGLATGALTQLGQGTLPDGWSQAANAISPWLVVAFLAGSTMPGPGRAGLAGFVVLVLALVGYYAMTQLRFGIGGGTSSLVFWGLGALVGGPVFGIAGRAWRTGPHRRRAAALGLLSAAAIAEGAYVTLVLERPSVGAGFAVAGLLAPLALGRSRADRLGAYVATIPALALGALGYVVFLFVYDLTSRI
jgi:hypothetical protein